MSGTIVLRPSFDEAHELWWQLALRRARLRHLEARVRALRSGIDGFKEQYNRSVGKCFRDLRRLRQETLEYELRVRLVLSQPGGLSLAELEARLAQETVRTRWRSETATTRPGPEASRRRWSVDNRTRKEMLTVYRELAKRYHPDRARSEEERVHMHRIMARVNAAYDRGDLRQLWLMTQMEGPASLFEDGESLRQSVRRMERELAIVEEVVRSLEADLRRLEQSPEYRLHQTALRMAEVGRDLLAETEARLRREMDRQRAQLQKAKRTYESLVSLGYLANPG